MRLAALLLAIAAMATASSLSEAQETCHELTGGQFADIRHCVTSVRPSQDSTNFGPDHLLATGDGAWCASTARNQAITLYLKPASLLRTITFTNGYAKSSETFRQNGRVKRALIETNTGYQGYIDPRDIPASQKFIIARGTYAWVRFKILETTRGGANPNPCASEFLVNLEELNSN
jgi:hypothetical protein